MCSGIGSVRNNGARKFIDAKTMGDYLLDKLQAFSQIKELRGRGLMIGIEMPEEFAHVKKDLLMKHGIFTGEAKPNTIRLLPALNITKTEADSFLESFAATLK
jgi:acetylornithine aminotransferase